MEWRPEGHTLIRKGWDQLYLDRIFAEETLTQAKKDHDDRHALHLREQAAHTAMQAVEAGALRPRWQPQQWQRFARVWQSNTVGYLLRCKNAWRVPDMLPFQVFTLKILGDVS